MVVTSRCLDTYRDRRSKSCYGVGGTLGIHVAVSKLGKVSGFCVTFLEVYRSEVLRAAATLDHVTEVSVSEEEGVEWRERMGES